jgi:hypothetical protein
MRKRVAILQSNYIPWKGYFDIIHDVDELIFHDDLQYTKQDWRNRNRIKTRHGPEWLTIPVGSSEKRLLCDVELPNPRWAREHWRRLEACYRTAPFFETYRPFFEPIYLDPRCRLLSELNQRLIRSIAGELLGITTSFADTRSLRARGRKQDRVLDILRQAGAAVYVSGPAAQAYLDPERFASEGVEVVWKDYQKYPEYEQLYPPFAHEVTILDLLFHTGPAAPWHIWGWRQEAG